MTQTIQSPRYYDDFVKLVEEAEQARNQVTVAFEKAYYGRQDTSRLQQVFDKMTARIIRRKSHAWLLDAAHSFPNLNEQ